MDGAVKESGAQRIPDNKTVLTGKDADFLVLMKEASKSQVRKLSVNLGSYVIIRRAILKCG